MPSENVELVRKVTDFFNQREVDQALELTSEDFVMDWSNSIGPLKGIYRGRDEVIGLWRTFLDAWEEIHWDPDEIVDIDDRRVMIVNRVRMRGRGSGVWVEASGVQVWTIDGGLGRSIKLYQSKPEALEALGLGK